MDSNYPIAATADAVSAMLATAQPLLAQTGAGTASRDISGTQWLAVLIVLAVLVLPFMAGNRLAKLIKMPTHGTRFGAILLAIIASAVVLSQRLPSRGVDLRGGTILVYEIDPSVKTGGRDGEGSSITSQDLIEPLTRRINPAGTQEIVIRPYGESQIEIIVPEVDQREVDRIKRLVEEAGILRFAILANQVDHQPFINLATEQAESPSQSQRLRETVSDDGGETVGLWAEVDREIVNEKQGPLRVNVVGATLRNPDTGRLVTLPPEVRTDDAEQRIADWIDEQGFSGLEALMIIDPLVDITGEDLSFAASTFDQDGSPAVAFNMNDVGAGKMRVLTTNNSPVGNRKRQLGIILDNRLLSAPNIQTAIGKEGRITGRFTRTEVQQLVDILKAGQLPAAITKQPIAENQIDATLGADTIRKGFFAIGISLSLVLVFILFYYRFAGVIACTALVLNLAMILATMVLINQPLTLPGLAGLVLTVGMSVDANVLIFERIREEIKKGSAARMAVRNGFAKATVTIIDANLTTLITAIVLYAIGTDQIRGFAVTLILGILFSMFTAIYVSRTIFDIAERHGFLSLGMADYVNSFREKVSGAGGLDFMSKGKIALTLSGVLVTVGIASIFARGGTLLDIDFAGGSSVQFQLNESVTTDRVRDIVGDALVVDGQQLPFTVNGVSMESAPDGTVYKVDSSLDQVDELKAAVAGAFAAADDVGMVTYQVTISPDGEARRLPRPSDRNGVMLAVAQADNEPPASIALPTDPQDGTVISSSIIELGVGGSGGGAEVNAATLKAEIVTAAAAAGIELSDRAIGLTPLGEGTSEWTEGSSLTFGKWKVGLPLSAGNAASVMENVKSDLNSDPVWISSSSVGARVAGDMIGRAFGALFASLLCIIGYIWFRFQRVIYGFAAVAALIHDVAITLGAIAISYWLADVLGFLLIDPFKISLVVVAAILTIIGYSLNDTIVVFDRIRETKGKAPNLTSDMINWSINQTLSRTLLTSITTLIVVVLLYLLGGEGIHAFAFALVIGVLVGTYSSVFVASPILLYLVQRDQKTRPGQKVKTA